ncbi:MAG: serine protease [Planctomycetes bacterium]|nr:serine protease [Planctomycetota bacterium]
MSAMRLTRPHRIFLLLFGLALIWLALVWPASQAPAGETNTNALVPPSIFEKATPETPKELLEIQRHVRRVLDKTIPATVGIRLGQSQGSGVIISKDGTVLTAGHVSNTPGKTCEIILSDGKKLKGKTLGWNKFIDSGMVKITDSGEFPYCEMGKSAELKKGQWCLAIGHPGGWQPGRTPVVRLGRMQEISKSFLRSDCTLVGGDSGGPLFDMTGKVIGIHSRIGPLITANIHVPVDTYRETWDRLVAAEEWGGGLLGFGAKGPDAWLGLEFDGDKDGCKISKVKAESPAEKAGLKAQDIITLFAGQKVTTSVELSNLMMKMKPGSEVEVIVRRGEQTVNLHVTLGKRPAEKG